MPCFSIITDVLLLGTGKAAPEFTRNLGKRMILRATGGCLLAAAITSGIYFYYGCYVQVNQV